MKTRTVQVKVLSTDANTDTYKSSARRCRATRCRRALAENFYNALAQLQYEGAFAIMEVEVRHERRPVRRVRVEPHRRPQRVDDDEGDDPHGG